ncbi:hypothetical protein HMPREF9554_00113 [Treponema phagedenis F0421]|nr:hypothetical protein HMPREF9554_00113 [Treponema phagedenis F0421]
MSNSESFSIANNLRNYVPKYIKEELPRSCILGASPFRRNLN